MHFKRCMESMTKEYETKMKEESAESIKASLAEQKSVCDCIILSLEDRYSYVDWINIQASPGPEFFESIKEIAAECV